jgi:cobalt-zinc-cadmium efflux system outer membrane protein
MRKVVLLFVGLAVSAPAAGQAPPFPAPAAPGGGLAAMVAELEQRNPELAAARRDVDMRVARIAPAGAPPDPTLSIGYMSGFLRPPFFPSSATPDAYRQVGISQELPYPGKLALRSRVAASDADIARWAYEDTRVRLVAELKAAYVEHVFTARGLDIVRRNKALVEQFRRIAEVRFTVGKAAQPDVLKAQLEISLLLEREAVLERQRATLQAEINRLLYRPAETPVETQDAFDIRPVTQTVDELRAAAVERYPAARRDEQQIDRGQQALKLARRELLPDFAVNVTSQRFVGDMPWMYGIDVMVKVPIFWQRKQRPMVAEAAAALDSARRMRESTVADAAARVTQAYVAMTTSQRLIDLYGDSVLPQARLALESSVAAYEVGTVDFLTLLMNFGTLLNYEVGYEEQKAQYRRTLAALEPLVGGAFIK